MLDLLTNLLDKLVQTLLAVGPLGVTVIVALEYACIPLASEILLPSLGFIASQGQISFTQTLIFSIIGGVIGVLAIYALGYYGGNPVLQWIMNRSPKTRKGITAALQWFDKYNKQSVFLARLLPVARTWISLPAGLAKMNIPSFVGFSFIGIVIWNTGLITLGYLLGDQWELVGEFISKYSYVVIAGVVLGAVALAVRYRRNRSAKEPTA